MPTDLLNRFQALDAFLHAHETLWKPLPFQLPVLPWEAQHPALSRALRALSDAHAAELEVDAKALHDWLTPYLPDISELNSLTTVDALPQQTHDYPSRFEHDIPGRKWQQVTAFVAAMPDMTGSLLEWCAGKAHLGRALHNRFKQPISSLEWDSVLCREAKALCEQHHCNVQVHECDVLSDAAIPHLKQADHAIALHACGDLHRRLITLAAEHGINSLHVSPCCYHLSADQRYRPLSTAACSSMLALTRDDLRLAVQETVTAPGITTERRHKKNAWRLGFDALQRELQQHNHYLPVPPIADTQFQGTFADFCQHAADLKNLTLPDGMDFDAFEARGWQRHHEVIRLDLLRHAFRRALEMWLVLDRALYLAEAGYRVTVGTFCERALTPRNLLISATRSSQNLSQ